MKDQDKTKDQLVHELGELRQRVANLEAGASARKPAEEMQQNQQGQVTDEVCVVEDITDRKQAEEALQQAHHELERLIEERTAELREANERLRIFQQFAETSGQGFSMADLDGHLMYMNPALCRMLAEDRPQDRLGQHISMYYPEEANRTRETERFPTLMRDGYWQGELPMLSRQGKLIPTWHNTFLIRDESGTPFRLAVVITDITEQKRAEQVLRDNELRWRQAMRIGNSYAFEWDVATDRVLRTPECVEVLRLADVKACQDTGHEFFQRVAAEDRNRLVEAVRNLTPAADTLNIEYRLRRGDGSIAFFRESARGFFDAEGRLVRLLGVIADVDREKRAEEALRQSERRFRNYFEQGLVGMAATAPDKRWLGVNDRICEILGYSREELYQKTWAELTHPEDLGKDVEQYGRLLQGEIPSNRSRPGEQ